MTRSRTRTPAARTPGKTPEAAVPIIRPDGPLLCLDPSSSACGWAIFDPSGRPVDFGVIRPPARLDSVARTDRIVAGVLDLYRRHRPAGALLEWASGKTHGRIAKASGLAVLGQAQGSIRTALAIQGCPVALVDANDWTFKVPKHKRASMIALAVPGYAAMRVGGKDPGDDIADAIGIGLWHFDRIRGCELLERATINGR